MNKQISKCLNEPVCFLKVFVKWILTSSENFDQINLILASLGTKYMKIVWIGNKLFVVIPGYLDKQPNSLSFSISCQHILSRMSDDSFWGLKIKR